MSNVWNPAGGRSSAVYWRRRILVGAAALLVLLIVLRACAGGDGPDLPTRASGPPPAVPLLPTDTPSPVASAPSDRVIDAGKDGLATAPRPVGGQEADPASAGSAVGSGVGSGQVGPGQVGSGQVGSGSASRNAPAPAAGRQAADERAGEADRSSRSGSTADSAQTAATASEKSGSSNGVRYCRAAAMNVEVRSEARRYPGAKEPKLLLQVTNTGDQPCLVDVGSRALTLTIYSGKERIWSSDDCQGKGTSDVRLLRSEESLTARSVWSRTRSAPGCPKGQPAAKPGTYKVEGSVGDVDAERAAVFELT